MPLSNTASRRSELPWPSEDRANGAFHLRLVENARERRDVFKLRYRAYAEYGIDDTAQDGQFLDAFDSLPTTALFGAYSGATLVGAMRLCFSLAGKSLASLPCSAYYPALGAVKTARPGSLMEVSRLAIDPGISNRSFRTTLFGSLVRSSLIAAQAAGVATILVATRPEWVRFYKYMLGFEMIGEPVLYPPGDTKISLLGGSLAMAESRQRRANAFFRISPAEIAQMRLSLAPMLVQAVVPA